MKDIIAKLAALSGGPTAGAKKVLTDTSGKKQLTNSVTTKKPLTNAAGPSMKRLMEAVDAIGAEKNWCYDCGHAAETEHNDMCTYCGSTNVGPDVAPEDRVPPMSEASQWEEQTPGLDEPREGPIGEAAPPYNLGQVFPNTKEGVLQYMQYGYDKSFLKKLDLPTCDIHSDPQVEGVWAVDSMASGFRCVIYLAGYRNPWGNKREHNDNEEGGFTLKHMISLVRSGSLTPKLMKYWDKCGSLDDGDLDKLMAEYREWNDLDESMVGESNADDLRAERFDARYTDDTEFDPLDAETLPPEELYALFKKIGNATGRSVKQVALAKAQGDDRYWRKIMWVGEATLGGPTQRSPEPDEEFNDDDGDYNYCEKCGEACPIDADRCDTCGNDGIDEGRDEEGISAEELTNVLFDRLEARFPNAVNQFGAEAVWAEAEQVALFHAGATELGTSDISIMVNQVLKYLQPKTEGVVDEASNHLGEPEQRSFHGWRAACRRKDPAVWFDGDKDIAQAMVGPRPYQAGVTKSIGEWDGSVGSVYNDNAPIATEGAYGDDGWEPPWEEPEQLERDPDREYDDMRQRELDEGPEPSQDKLMKKYGKYKGRTVGETSANLVKYAGKFYPQVDAISLQLHKINTGGKDTSSGLAEAGGQMWEVSWWVEEKSYDDRPGREYQESELVSAPTAQAAFQIIKDRPKQVGKMRYDFKVLPAKAGKSDIDESNADDERDERADAREPESNPKPTPGPLAPAMTNGRWPSEPAAPAPKVSAIIRAALPPGVWEKGFSKVYGDTSYTRTKKKVRWAAKGFARSLTKMEQSAIEAQLKSQLASVRGIGEIMVFGDTVLVYAETPIKITDESVIDESKSGWKDLSDFVSVKGKSAFVDRFNIDTDEEITQPGERIKFTRKGKTFSAIVTDEAVGRDDDMYILTDIVKESTSSVPLKKITEGKTTMRKTKLNESVDTGNAPPELAAILRHYGKELKDFVNNGDLDDDLYSALYDYYFDDMPYGTKKARTGDPYEWISQRLDSDLGGVEDYADHNAMDPFDADDPAPGVNQPVMPNEGFGGDIMPLEGVEADSFEPEPMPGDEIVTELQANDEARITDMLTNVGLDHGLDFWFEGDEIVVIGSREAKVVTSTVGGHIQSIDGEEFRIGAKSRAAKAAPADLDDLAAVPEVFEGKFKDQDTANKEKRDKAAAAAREKKAKEAKDKKDLKEEVDPDDVALLSMQYKSGQLSYDEFRSKLDGLEHTDYSMRQGEMGNPDMRDYIRSSDDDDHDYGNSLDDEEYGDEVGESEYANEPDPSVHTSTTDMINQGNDLNRPKKSFSSKPYRGDNPMAESRKLLTQYEQMKAAVSLK